MIRFLIGGALVSLFALIGDLVRPKGFAGLFAAAPSVALATLALTAADKGAETASLAARSMIVGELAFITYAVGCLYLLAIKHVKSARATIATLVVWGAVASGLYMGILH